MGSYNLSDFVTGFPIVEFSEKTYVLIISEKVKSMYIEEYNSTDIDKHFMPVTFPMYGKFDGYGRFKLVEEYKEENEFAVNYFKAKEENNKKNLVDDEGRIGEQELEKQGLLLSATLISYYEDCVINVEDPTDYDLETMTEHPFDELLEIKVGHYGKWLNSMEQEKKEKGIKNDTIEDSRLGSLLGQTGTIILKPSLREMNIFKTIHGKLDPEYDTQMLIYKEYKKSDRIKEYLYQWMCFYAYLQEIGVMFRPIVSIPEVNYFEEVVKDFELRKKALEELKKEYDDYMD